MRVWAKAIPLGAAVIAGAAHGQRDDEAGIRMLMERHEQYVRTSSANIQDDALRGRIIGIACEVNPALCGEIRVYVVRAPGFNAMMAPNGMMMVFSGMLLRSRDDAEIAAVLGHEMAHYHHGHGMANLRRTKRTSSGLAILSAVVGVAGQINVATSTSYESLIRAQNLSNTAALMVQAAHVVAGFQLLAFSRAQESEADLQGMAWASEARYDQAAAASLWRTLMEEHEAGGEEAGFSLLSTHPTPARRIADIEANMAAPAENPYFPSPATIPALVSKHRLDWLNDELHALSPKQFAHVAAGQRDFDIPEGTLQHLQGISWIQYARRQEKMNDETIEAYTQAVAALEAARASGEFFPADALLELGHARMAIGDNQEAVDALERYLDASPGAWNAEFVAADIRRLKEITP